MKLVFFGTPEFAAYSLKTLMSEHEVTAVVTQPDKPRGRGGNVSFSPVKVAALAAGIPALQPERLGSGSFFDELYDFGADIFVVAAYGKKLPERLLNLPRYGAVNIHASLLPKYRGAAPIQRAIMNGETMTGITIIQMDKGIDTGDILLRKQIAIADGETGGELHDKLAALGAEAVSAALFLIEKGEITREKQDDSQSSYASMIDGQTGRIDWRKDPDEIINLIRALDPVPGAYTTLNDATVKIFRGRKTDFYGGDPGGISVTRDGEMLVGTGGCGIVVNEIQKTGGKRMRSDAFLRGNRVAGERFE